MTLAENKVLEIYAPMSGVLRPLDAIPDAAFAQRLIGDGIAIDPLDELVRSPIAGTVMTIAGTGHAITVRSEEGVEILIHIGIDSVRLNGRGFKVLVDAGQTVARGEVLIELDLDLIGREAKSLITPVLLVSGHQLGRAIAEKSNVAAGEVILLVDLKPPADGRSVLVSQQRSTAHIHLELGLSHGLHARPSGRIAALARAFDGTVTITHGDKSADAASVTDLMSLGARFGSEIEIRAIGERPREIAISIANLLKQLADGEDDETKVLQSALQRQTASLSHIPRSDSAISAVIASPGLAVGPVFVLQTVDIEICEKGRSAEIEHKRLDQAIKHASAQLSAAIASVHSTAKAIAEAHLEIIQDRALQTVAKQVLVTGASAEFAWRSASRLQEAALGSTGNARLQERAIDLRDVERRMLAQLTGVVHDPGAQIPLGAILLCNDVEPSLLISAPKGSIAGICTAQGGATSHAAILAASNSIPMLVAAGPSVFALECGRRVLLDAESGHLDPMPSPSALRQVAERASRREIEVQTTRLAAQELCHLTDGTRIEVFANLATVADAQVAVDNGAEGCGLLRTEFIFANSTEAPDEELQQHLYSLIANALDGRPLIIRTLDVGGDKPIAYLPFAKEPNPALGMRGIRFALNELDILRTQLRAMIRGVVSSQLRIMLPMIVEVDEIARVRKMLAFECEALGLDHDIQIGIMIETPAAALLADQLAVHVDFLSIGSNDLSQYVLAMDRSNAALAARVDAYHPAVLRAIEMTAQGASRHGRWLGICGGLASDYLAAPLLVGLGCQELSSVPSAIPKIKQTLRTWSKERCRALALRALEQESAADVRALVSGEVR